jgi:hypothetical protein
MDRIINWLLLTIIFVFDPLAIALVIAANFAFEQSKTKNDMNLLNWLKKKPTPQPESQIEESLNLDLTSEILIQEEIIEEKPTDSLLEAVKEYQKTQKEKSVTNTRDLKIKQKFNRSEDDLTIKY